MPASANPTNLAALWVPQIWVQGAAEQMRNLPSAITSGIALRNALFDGFADGAGETVNLPAFHDPTDANDEVQQENADANSDVLSSMKQVAVMLNRQKRWDVTALSAAVSGADPVSFALSNIAMNRLKNRQKTLIAILRGIFGTAAIPGCCAGATYDITAGGAGIGSNNLIKRTSLTASLTLLGELAEAVINGGVMITHPVIREALAGQNTSIALLPAETPLIVKQFGGLQIFASNALVTTVNGQLVYETYISRPGTVAWGEKPQIGDNIGVSSMQMFLDKQSNNTYIFDRTRCIIHPNGIKWNPANGVPALESPSNVELQAAGNWNLQFSTVDRVGIVCIRSNG